MSGCVGGSQQAYVSCLEDCTCLATTAYAQYCHAAFEMNASTSARERERERERPWPWRKKDGSCRYQVRGPTGFESAAGIGSTSQITG